MSAALGDAVASALVLYIREGVVQESEVSSELYEVVNGRTQGCCPYFQPRSANLWMRVITSRGDQASGRGSATVARLIISKPL